VKEKWTLIFHEEPLRFVLSLRGKPREMLVKELERLCRDPFRQPSSFRTGLTIAYWLDALPEEIRIVTIKLSN
jgi:hypothetical protein